MELAVLLFFKYPDSQNHVWINLPQPRIAFLCDSTILVAKAGILLDARAFVLMPVNTTQEHDNTALDTD